MPTPLARLPETINEAVSLQPLVKPIGKLSNVVLRSEGRWQVLEGKPWLGHPAHPMFTDLPIGFFTSAFVLDVLGDERADTLIGLGVLSAAPTLATGLAEYGRTGPDTIRVAAAHAAANAAGVALYLCSWFARRSGARTTGKRLSLAAAGLLSLGGYLGGHLAYEKGVGVEAAGS